MKIAIATENNDPTAVISSQGARALFFLLFDADGKLIEILENPYTSDATRVGPNVANLLIDLHITKVVAGRFGAKFKEELEKKHVECVEQTGPAAQAAKELFDMNC